MTKPLFKPVINYADPLFDDRYPVFEYGRLADYLLQGLIKALISQGYTESEAVLIVQSRWLRKSLDAHEEDMQLMADAVANNYVRSQKDTLVRDIDYFAGIKPNRKKKNNPQLDLLDGLTGEDK